MRSEFLNVSNLPMEPLLSDEDDPNFIPSIHGPINNEGVAQPRRLLSKNGRGRTRRTIDNKWSLLYRQDWFHTICYTPWPQLWAFYFLTYIAFWVVFSVLYLPMTMKEQCRDETEVETWQDAMMLSVMISSTIGFGNVDVSFACSWYPFVVLMVQTLLGLALDAVLIGILIVKLSRPQHRQHSIQISSTAVINTDTGGEPELQIRLGEVRRQQLVETHVRMVLYEWDDDATDGDGCFDVTTTPLELQYAVEVDMYCTLTLPWLARHVVDASSPMTKYLGDDGGGQHFELVAIVEGIEPITGLTVQRVESYTAGEIRMGYKFMPCCRKSADPSRSVQIDFARLGTVTPCASS
mmetsp:Transcript_30085/g.90068  ORF Transcript_30085/g.90068 Transcript_30085/m.90068 type:complete len:351 (+) Transcript_30085:215-1267(+)|eukprot:CAMPEP_0206327786 /NCGR_PEP_ID=MMETSP0106_2-20121207/22337_1 /ASSEMBLY_ACC=CAM_ASM_000206 /TAXON_ID=81532 /ORGANISM="Acanthoeca-like sp., Strain 10tr" /LENGTH=350 /DNA_ID=CAMNT_0053760433 /DNA_START=291 /DNA_END=1343 /DNA_ORIENTATION=+